MKVCIQSEEGNFTVPVPGCLLRAGASLAIPAKYRDLGKLSGEFFREAERIKKQQGSWALVQVETADGTRIQIYV